MLQEKSTQEKPSSPASTPKKIRHWTPDKVKAVLKYLKTHSNNETMAHFKISSGQIHTWKHRGGVGYTKKTPPKPKQHRVHFDEYALAKRLQRALAERLRQGEPLDDFIITAHTLCERILNHG